MPEKTKTISPANVLAGPSPLVLTAWLEPVAGLVRFQPAGFPEVGHVIYKAPRDNATEESVCIVDSAASMANHLESVCLRGAHDYELVEDLSGMPYVRCVTGEVENGELNNPEVVVTSLTEGHRIASTYFLGGKLLEKENRLSHGSFEKKLIQEFGIVLSGSTKAHPPAEKWWNVFKTIFDHDPNSLVHGVLFPQWNIKIPRVLTAHLEAFGAGRVDRSGVKFDRLGKTTSGQPIFAVDDAVAREIRVTFVLDVSLVRSFGRKKKGTNGEEALGLSDKQKEFLVALALWKIRCLLAAPFRFRSGCHLRLQQDGLKVGEWREDELKEGERSRAEIDVDIKGAITGAAFGTGSLITDVFWPREELYREGRGDQARIAAKDTDTEEAEDESEE